MVPSPEGDFEPRASFFAIQIKPCHDLRLTIVASLSDRISLRREVENK